MPNEKTILLDLDDTIAIDQVTMKESIVTVAKLVQKKYNIDPEKLHDILRVKARELWHTFPTYEYCLHIGISSREGLWGNFIADHEKEIGLDKVVKVFQVDAWDQALKKFEINDRELAEELSAKLFEDRRQRHVLFPESVDVMKDLGAKYRLGLLTNGSSTLQWEKIKGLDVEPFFEHIFVSGDIGVGKPKKEIFLYAMEKFGVDNNDIVMVGNSITNDIAGAKNAGIKSILIDRGDVEGNEDIQPDEVIADLKELEKVL